MTKQILCMVADVSIEAAAIEGDKKSSPKFNVVAYTGGQMNLGGWDLPIVVDLQGMSFGKSIVANLDHDRSKRVGNVTAKEISDDGLTLSGVVSAATDHAREVVDSAANGFVWQASIEASPDVMTEVASGKTTTVNGREFTGPLYVATKSTLKGFAFVSHGADDNTTATIAASAESITPEKKTMAISDELKAFIESVGLNAETLTAEQTASFEANFAGKPTPKKETVQADDIFAERKIELLRVNSIRKIADDFCEGRTLSELDAIQKLHDHAIEAKSSPQDFRIELALSPVPKGVTIVAPRAKDNLSKDVLEAAICVSGRLGKVEEIYSDQVLQAAHDRFRNGVGVKQLYRILAKEHGYKQDDDQVTLDMHRHACGLQAGHNGMEASSGFSTISLPGILSNVAQKFMLEGWGGGEMVWRDVSAIRNVRDFKQVSSYKLGGNLKYEKVGADGELKHGSVAETTYTNQASTYGKMFAVTRTDIINDDLGAFTQVPRELGYGANESFNEVFWTEFLSADATFFDAGNNNVSAGVFSASASTATLTAAELAFMKQTKPNGTPLGAMADRILVPHGAYRVALAAMNSSMVVGTTGPTPSANTFAGNYAVLTSGYISNAAYSGNSAIKWYMLANPSRMAVIEAAFLNGREAPIVETADTSFNTLGIQMRGYHDFGCNLQEYRAGVQGTGA